MAGSSEFLYIHSKENTILYEDEKMSTHWASVSISDVLGYSWNSSGNVTALSNSLGGQPLDGNTLLSTLVYMSTINLYDVTPEPEPETITGFFLDGTEYKIGGDIAWGNISGTLSDQIDLQTALNAKQNSLATQTAYTSKGTATKVPTITTNSLGQVTAISETSISFPVTSVNGSTGAVTGLQTTANLKTSLSDNSDSYYPSQKAVKTAVDGKQATLVSGTNIKTINNNSLLGSGNITIESGTEYNAGEGIEIGDITINGRQGPSPEGFHVPSTDEWQGLKTIMDGLSITTGDNWRINLHMPFVGYRNYSDASIKRRSSVGHYWSSSPFGSSYPYYARELGLNSSSVNASGYNYRAIGSSVRCFKNLYVAPNSTWTVVQGTLGNAGIFWNQSEGLISITNGTTGYTMMDKNLGATTVYNDGDTLTQANMGNMYQWGNNYGFPSTGTISNTSSTQVDASSYGPTNPYLSDTFITGSNDWSSVYNDDLWGDTTGTITQENVISNTGVLSVNGQTGDVTVASPDMSNYLAKNNTTAFTPSGDYNPATKKYVDDGLSGKQGTLTTQTAYTTKGTSTKVPTITTNTLGQVTGITETSIAFPVTSVGGSTGAVGLKTINNTSLVGSGNISIGGISNNTTGTTTTVTQIWAGTESEYSSLSSKNATTIYFTF